MDEIIAFLIEKIQNQQCVLFLGPGMFRENAADANTLYESFAQQHATQIIAQNYPFDTTQSGNIYYTIPRYLRAVNSNRPFAIKNIVDIRKKFIEYSAARISNNPTFPGLAQLPFPIIISTNPDKTIHTQVANHRQAHFAYYNTSNKSPEDFSRHMPLTKEHFGEGSTVIYNLFGSYDTPSSLLLTEDELLNYTINVNQVNTRIPQALINELDDNKYYIFLGFHFDQWIVKIILRMLGLPKGDPTSRISFTVNGQMPQIYLKHYYEDDFRFYFIPEGNIDLFLASLNNAYQQLVAAPGIAPAAVTPKRKLVFLHHLSHAADTILAEKLHNHLKPLKDTNKLHLWSELFLEGSEDRELSIRENMHNADMIIVLMSDDFMGDYANRLTWLSQIYAQRTIKPRILCVLLRDYNYAAIESLAGHTWLPEENGHIKAVTLWEQTDQPLRQIADHIQHQLAQI